MASPDTLRRGRNWAVVGSATLVLAAIVFVYPLVVGAAIEALGVRGVAAALLALAMLALALPAAPPGTVPGPGHARLLPVLALLGGVVTGASSTLLLIPAALLAEAGAICFASLKETESLVERAVRAMVPAVPEFVRDYCRGLTRFWGWFFLGYAALLAVLALAAPIETWRAAATWGLASVVLVSCAVEFFVRKTRFRYYYHGGPFDRFWSRLFPAENTELGRRSQDYIRRYREDVGSGT